MIPAILNHLLQSTLFAAMAGVLTLLLRRNRARTRYWIWLTASIKFLIPFSLLISAGSYVDWRSAPAGASSGLSSVVEQVFVAPALAVTTPAVTQTRGYLPLALFAVWLSGFTVVLFSWWRQWHGIRAAVRNATPFRVDLPIPAVSSPAVLEPGVFGIFHPLLLLPEGITERLTPHELAAIVAHELCHVRYRDNLAAGIQMMVEAAFWFHPLVWWIGARLINERERACDEEVLRLGGEPQIYAEGILKVCEFYLESPLACVAGITGSNLRKRIRGIMTNRVAEHLGLGRKLLLAAAAAATIALPIAFGVLNSPQIRAQTQSSASAPLSFEVASIKPGRRTKGNAMGARVNPQGIEYTALTLRMLVADAYNVKARSISSSGPGLANAARRDGLGHRRQGRANGIEGTTSAHAADTIGRPVQADAAS